MIKNKLSEILGRKRMMQTELSRLSGVSYAAIKNLYKDKTKGIDFVTLNRLCNALDCTPNDIFEFLPD
ncbi:MAG: helix-turn-helix transcriptional regulator [Candidatus Gastranaerophilales bacterium]|nr:helix-turn-helix transcriptional regulator [Candidatus Gastranaerophilales bacterium]